MVLNQKTGLKTFRLLNSHFNEIIDERGKIIQTLKSRFEEVCFQSVELKHLLIGLVKTLNLVFWLAINLERTVKLSYR